MFVQKSINGAPQNLVLDLRAYGATGTTYNRVGHLTIRCLEDGVADAIILVRAIKVPDGVAAPAAVDLSLTNDYVYMTTADDQAQEYTIGSKFAPGMNDDVYQGNYFTHVMVSITAQGRLAVIGQ